MSEERADIRKRVAWFSVCGALLLIAHLTVENFLSTSYPWVLYCVPAVLMWPVAVFFAFSCRSKAGTIVFSWVSFVVLSGYYVALNFFLSSGFPWSCIVVGALLWYPVSLTLAGKPRAFAVFGFIWAVAFFSILNAVTTPDNIWSVYPIFGVFWWPLSVFFFSKKRVTQAESR